MEWRKSRFTDREHDAASEGESNSRGKSGKWMGTGTYRFATNEFNRNIKATNLLHRFCRQIYKYENYGGKCGPAPDRFIGDREYSSLFRYFVRTDGVHNDPSRNQRVLMYAALKNDLFQLDEVTAAYRISTHHLAKVVQTLARLGYLETRRGRGGGLKLARPADQIPLGKLLQATEKDPHFLECFQAGNTNCVINGHCRLKGILAQALNSFYAVLDQHTLRDLVTGPHRDRMREALLRSPV